MATVMNPRSHQLMTTRTAMQKVCIALGILFILAGLGGIVMPDLMGMHLSMMHNLIHLVSGGLSLWVGYSDDVRRAYLFSITFGIIYGLLGIGGFFFGVPGYPGVGNMQADPNLLRLVPNVLEFGTADHTVHLIFSLVFLVSAIMWKSSRANLGQRSDFERKL